MLLQLDKTSQLQALDWTGFNRLPAEDELLGDARIFVSAAAVVTDQCAIALLSLTCDLRGRDATTSLRPWSPGPIIGAPLAGADLAGAQLEKAFKLLTRHGRRLCTSLAARWPSIAMPPIIGLVSDGQGVAISQDHPSAMDPSWLIDHIRGDAPASAIIPFDAAEAWLRLSGTERGQQQH